MVQWFLPGFSACIQRFETRLTSGILLDAGMSWRVQDLFVLCCRQVWFCPSPESCCVSSRFVVKRRIWNCTIHNFQYRTRHNINSYVGYRRLLTLESKSLSVDRLTLNPVNSAAIWPMLECYPPSPNITSILLSSKLSNPIIITAFLKSFYLHSSPTQCII